MQINTITEVLTGIVSRVTYHNAATGWSVLRVHPFQSANQQENITIHRSQGSKSGHYSYPHPTF